MADDEIPMPADDELPEPSPDFTEVHVPDLGRTVTFVPRDRMRRRSKKNAFVGTLGGPSLPAVALPIDWTRNGELDFPGLGNETYGDCFYAASCHQDQSMTGCVGPAQSRFDANAVVKAYLALAGGDRGLYEEQMVGEWMNKGLAGDKDARIFSHCDIEPTNAPLMQAALYFFGGVQFQMSTPSAWINGFKTGGEWGAGVRPNKLNGHAVHFSGVDAQGRYRVQTWGSYCWMTPAGLQQCDPDAFVVASLRWFDAQGYAPNGLHYTQLAPLWRQLGGDPWPASPYPAPGPAPTPTPTPSPVTSTLSFAGPLGIYKASVTITVVPDDSIPTPK